LGRRGRQTSDLSQLQRTADNIPGDTGSTSDRIEGTYCPAGRKLGFPHAAVGSRRCLQRTIFRPLSVRFRSISPLRASIRMHSAETRLYR